MTRVDRFNKILATGAIVPNPGFQNWHAIGGEECCSYARKLDGVSLFDFEDFSPEIYEEKYPCSSWWAFVPFIQDWGCAVWIEIDRDKIASCLISRCELLTRHRL